MIMGNNDSKERKVLSDEELEQVSGGSLQSIALRNTNCVSERTKEECEQFSRCEWVYEVGCVRKGPRPHHPID